MKNVVFWDVTPRDSCKTRSFGELSSSIIKVTRMGELGTTLAFVFLRSVLRLLVTDNVVPTSPTLVTPMMEAPSSSEASILTRATRRNIQEDGILPDIMASRWLFKTRGLRLTRNIGQTQINTPKRRIGREGDR
jgi:hypothetical protein